MSHPSPHRGRPEAGPARPESRRLWARVAGAVAALALISPGAAQALPNPADHPALLGVPIEAAAYDYAMRCKPRSTPGIRLLAKWIDRHFRGESWGVFRCERLGRKRRSLHSEGRALDWHLDVRRKRERRAAYHLIDRLLATDAVGEPNALARRMGVQELIYDCKSWFSGSERLGRYSGCRGKVGRTAAHRDHVHIGLNRPGARAKTSFWRSPLARR